MPARLDQGLYSIIWNKCEELDLIPLAVNGTDDHIHILLKSHTEITIAQILKHVKGTSSRWLNENGNFVEPFRWQRGYGLFTVSPKDVDMIISYIKKQKEHHRM